VVNYSVGWNSVSSYYTGRAAKWKLFRMVRRPQRSSTRLSSGLRGLLLFLIYVQDLPLWVTQDADRQLRSHFFLEQLSIDVYTEGFGNSWLSCERR